MLASSPPAEDGERYEQFYGLIKAAIQVCDRNSGEDSLDLDRNAATTVTPKVANQAENSIVLAFVNLK